MVKHGSPADSIYVVRSGCVKVLVPIAYFDDNNTRSDHHTVTNQGDKNKLVEVATLGPGDVLDETVLNDLCDV